VQNEQTKQQQQSQYRAILMHLCTAPALHSKYSFAKSAIIFSLFYTT